jgi:cell division protein FtsQ
MTGRIIRSRRLKDRRRSVRRDRLRTFTRRATAILVIAGTITAGVAVAGSSLFGLSDVEVSGARNVTSDRVRAVAALPLGANVLTLDLDAARRRVESIEEIRSAEVRRSGALGVRITVVERTPAVVVRAGGGPRYFDVDGIEVDGPVRGRVPVVRLAVSKRAVADGRMLAVEPRPDRDLIVEVLRVWNAAPDLRSEITRFDATSEGMVVIVAGARTTLGAVGDRDDVRAKVAAIRAITTWAEEHGAKLRSIDVRVPEHPALRLA